MAANIFDGSTDSNWGTAANWSLGTVPTASDGNVATFDATSPACTVNASARVCNGIDFTGYTNTITMSFQITVSGNVTLAAGMGVAGSGLLALGATGTLTSNGKTWPNALSLATSGSTITLADNWNVDGTLTLTGTTVTVNGFQINAGAGLSIISNSISGTTLIVMDGTGTISPNAGVFFKNNFTINTAGTITVGTANPFQYTTGTFTYTAGTVVTTGSTASFGTTSTSTTLAVAGITWNDVSFTGVASTVSLNENLNVTGLLTTGNGTAAVTLNGSTINASAGVRYGGTTGTVSGTTVINVNGTGTLDGPSATSGRIDNPITINAPGGTVTIATAGDTAFRVLLNQLNCVAGTIVTDTGTWTAFGGGGGGMKLAGSGGLAG